MTAPNTWPRGDEYQQAVQQPSFVFSDPDLKKCSAETDQLGLPKPYSGGFTTTYHLQSNSHHFAVRCFIRDVPDLQHRYSAIEKFLNTTSHIFFTPATCLNKGIQVNATWYPIIKMNWIDGDPLNIYIQKNLGNKELLERITNSFYALVQNLEKIGIAHGDLQHGNIIIKNDNLYLIDYDGIFLPTIADLQGNEIGHPNYQHPLRAKQHSGPTIDRFSAIVIYFALLSISQNPNLWNKYDTNENILFSRKDFIDNRHSKILEELAKYNDLSVFVERFKGICRCEFDKIPTLDQFISGEFSYPVEIITETVEQASSNNPPQKNEEILNFTVEGYPVIQSTDLHQLSVHIGDWIGLEGIIDGINQSPVTNKDSHAPALTLSFGRYPRDNFYVHIYPTSLTTFKKRNISPESFVNKHVRITGKLSQDQGKFRLNLEVPSQIEIIEGNSTQLISKSPQKCEEITTTKVEEYPVIQSTDLHQLSIHAGDWIRLEGEIDEVIFSSSNYSESNKPLFTLNFGCTPFENISLFIYPTTIDAFNRRNIKPDNYIKKTVCVTGVVRQNNGKLGMNLEVPSQIEIIEKQKAAISKSPQKREEITDFTVEGYPVIQSTDLPQLSVHIGDWIGLEGIIDGINQSPLTDKNSNVPALTLSFGRYPRDNIYVHIYPSSLITFKKRNIAPESFVNKHVRITGKLSQGQGKFRLNLEVPSQIQIIDILKESSQTEERQSMSHAYGKNNPIRSLKDEIITESEANLLNEIYNPSLPLKE